MNQTVSMTVGTVGQEPVRSETPSISSFSTVVPGLDLNFVWVVSVIYTGAALLFVCFSIARVSRWITLRKPVALKVDDNGNTALHLSKTKQILGWPGVILSKCSLRSFKRIGVPSLGIILLLCFWIGLTALSCVWFVLPRLSFEGLAYRLP